MYDASLMNKSERDNNFSSNHVNGLGNITGAV